MPLIELDVRPAAIDGLRIVTMKQVSDGRGTVREFFRASVFESLDPPGPTHFAQVNVTESARGVIRGLHGETITKVVAVVAGDAFGAWVDARPDSATFGAVETAPLRLGTQVVVPPGVLNGFQSGEDGCQYLYGFDGEWQPGMPGVAVNALDPVLRIAWPISVEPTDRSLLSEKDAGLPTFAAATAR